MPTSFGEVEDALVNLYSGLTLNILGAGAKEVPVFLGSPDPELTSLDGGIVADTSHKVYPSIVIEFEAMDHELENEDSHDRDKISEDTSSVPHVSTIRKSATWYRLTYRVHLWVARDADADRKLTAFVVMKSRPRDCLSVGSETYNMFRDSPSGNEVISKDRAIYHRMFRVEVVVDLVDENDVETVKQVHEIHFDFIGVNSQNLSPYRNIGYGESETPPIGETFRHLPVDENDEATTAKNAEILILDKIAFDDTDIWTPPDD